MSVTAAQWIVNLVGVYLGVGLLFSVPFVLRWVGRVDPAASGGTLGFRLLITPGVAALWPLLAARVLARRTAPPEERNAHRCAARRRAPREERR